MRTKIQEALGEVSALFMCQGDTPAGELVMPTEDLIRICNELMQYVNVPRLGCATTGELLSELSARAEVAGYANYRTVDEL